MTNLTDKIGMLDGNARAPLYQQMQDALRRGIEGGALRPQEALPPERDIAKEFGISRITVRKAVDGLVADGMLTRRQGAGTFVGGRVEKQFSKLTSFTEDMAARGRTARSEWITQIESSVNPDESLTLGLSPGSRVFRFHRIRYADDQPMALEYSTIPGFGLPGLEAVGASLYEALDAAGHRPVRALQRLRAVLFDKEQAKLLDIEAGAPGLFIERRGFLEDGRAIEMTHSWYRGDTYDFVAELNALA
ncbi:MAG: GntR family transcriptional regulator [Candidatus Sphingomonas phytovorans]|nr:GntR family transcriptional regulator [Sphingomonas sp.]WEK02680.1 MAG: GntR family transcriptional regulator [Sphingomonas sp.]